MKGLSISKGFKEFVSFVKENPKGSLATILLLTGSAIGLVLIGKEMDKQYKQDMNMAWANGAKYGGNSSSASDLGDDEGVVEYLDIDPRKYLENHLPYFHILPAASQQSYIYQIGPVTSGSLVGSHKEQVQEPVFDRAEFEIWLRTTYVDMDEKTILSWMNKYSTLKNGTERYDEQTETSRILLEFRKDRNQLQSLKEDVQKKEERK